MTNVAHHVKFTFDLFSRLKRETHWIVGKKLRISFQCDEICIHFKPY